MLQLSSFSKSFIVITCFIVFLDFYIRLLPNKPDNSIKTSDDISLSVPRFINEYTVNNIERWLAQQYEQEDVEVQPDLKEEIETPVEIQSGDVLSLFVDDLRYRLVAVVNDAQKQSTVAVVSTDDDELFSGRYSKLSIGDELAGFEVIDIGSLNIVFRSPMGNIINLLLFERETSNFTNN